MAEALAALGAVASVAQLADYGFKLSIKLFAYSEAVSRADSTIQSLSNEVSLTSAVLRELSATLAADEARFISNSAVEATMGTVRECLAVFEALGAVLDKSVSGSSSLSRQAGRGLRMADKLKWPFLQPKVELLRSNLDRLKASLTLMLQVLSYAKDIASRKKDQESLAYQKTVIESLSRKENEASRKYTELQRLIQDSESQAHQPIFLHRATTTSNTSSQPPPPYEAYANSSVTANRSITAITSDEDGNSSSHVGELILLFNLVHNLLIYHISNASSSLQYKAYLQFRKATESAHETELEILEKAHGEDAFHIGAEAARNAVHLQLRLRELAARHKLVLTAKQLAVDTKSPVEEKFTGHPKDSMSRVSPGYNKSGYNIDDPTMIPQLTAEEQEETEIQAIKQELRLLKQQDVASTRNALRALGVAEETGYQTLERLGAQGELIPETERNLDAAGKQDISAPEKVQQLKALNRSMFAVHVASPSKSAERTKEQEELLLAESRRRPNLPGYSTIELSSNSKEPVSTINTELEPQVPSKIAEGIPAGGLSSIDPEVSTLSTLASTVQNSLFVPPHGSVLNGRSNFGNLIRSHKPRASFEEASTTITERAKTEIGGSLGRPPLRHISSTTSLTDDVEEFLFIEKAKPGNTKPLGGSHDDRHDFEKSGLSMDHEGLQPATGATIDSNQPSQEAIDEVVKDLLTQWTTLSLEAIEKGESPQIVHDSMEAPVISSIDAERTKESLIERGLNDAVPIPTLPQEEPFETASLLPRDPTDFEPPDIRVRF